MRPTGPHEPDSGRARLGILLAALCCPVLSGCLLFAGRHWEEARTGTIEPINRTLHMQLPRSIAARDLDSVMAFYSPDAAGTGVSWNDPVEISQDFNEKRIRWTGPEAAESIDARYRQLFEVFDYVEKADLRVHRVHWDHHETGEMGGQGRGFPADIRLIVRGKSAGGARQILQQSARVWIAERDGRWLLTGEQIIGRELVTSTAPAFELATEPAGIDDRHDTAGAPAFRLIGDTTISSGSAVGDLDCDGWEDIALLGSSRVTAYKNGGDGTFRNVSVDMGFGENMDIAGTGLVAFDADNDGDLDLWLSGVRGERFFRNDDCGSFVDATDAAGLGKTRWSSMPVVADYDLDGFLDVYVVRMGDHSTDAPKPNWQAVNGVTDSLYHNNGDGTFTDVSRRAGIRQTGWGLAAGWSDYNADGYPDLYVGNEFGHNALYRNDRDGTFTEVAASAGVLDRGAAMGVSWGDYDNDGHIDLFVSNMYANSRWVLFHPEFPSPVPWYFSWVPRSDVDQITDELTRGSSLLRNNGDGTFTDVSDAAGVRDCQWGWGAAFLDYNNDGWLDVYATNGFVSGRTTDDL
jgi:hypothetical protein